MCVYIPPSADVTAAVDTLAEQIMSVERQHPDSLVIVVDLLLKLETLTGLILAGRFPNTGRK